MYCKCMFILGITKNNKLDVLHGFAKSLRVQVYCGDKDVLMTYKLIVKHRPKFEKPKLERYHPFLFTSLKSKKYKFNGVWFAKSFMGRNILSNITRNLIDGIKGFENKTISNKSGRTTGITSLKMQLWSESIKGYILLVTVPTNHIRSIIRVTRWNLSVHNNVYLVEKFKMVCL